VETKVDQRRAGDTLERAQRRTCASQELEIVLDAKAVDALALGGSGSMPRGVVDDRARSTRRSADPAASALDKLDSTALKAHHRRQRSAVRLPDARTSSTPRWRARDGLAGPNLQSRDARLALQGSPEATVRVRDALTVTVAGSGSVAYYGKPRITQTIMGSGSVRNAGD
jgi:hypothetical protein